MPISCNRIYLLAFLGITAVLKAQEKPDTTNIPPRVLPEVEVLDTRETAHKRLLNPQESITATLKTLSGVQLISRGNTGQEAIFRGQDPKRLQVQIEGMRLFGAGPARMDPAISYFDQSSIQAAQVYSSTQAPGNFNGLSGTLHLTLQKPAFKPQSTWQAAIDATYHSNTSGIENRFKLSYGAKKWAFNLSASQQKHQNYQSGNGTIINLSQYEKRNFALAAATRLHPKEILRVNVIVDQLIFAGFPAVPMDASRSNGLITKVSYQNFKPLAGFKNFSLSAYYNRLYHHMDDARRKDVFMHMDMPSWSETIGLNFQARNWQKAHHQFDLSAEAYTNLRRAEMLMYSPNETEPNMFMLPWPDSRLSAAGLGLSHQWEKGKWRWSNTLRADLNATKVSSARGVKTWGGFGYEVGKTQTFFTSQLKTSLSYKIKTKQQVTAGLSYGSRAPNTSELYGYYLFNAHDAFDYMGNPQLQTEKLLNAELGYSFKTTRWSAGAQLFTMHYRHFILGTLSSIDHMTIRARGVREYKNLPRARFYGFQFHGEYRWSPQWRSNLQMEYLRGYIPQRFNLPLIPPLQATFTQQVHLKSWQLQASLEWAAPQFQYNENLGDQFTPGYALLNAGIQYPCKLKKAVIHLSVNAQNMLNNQYRNHLNWGGIPNMGRNIIFGVSIRQQEK